MVGKVKASGALLVDKTVFSLVVLLDRRLSKVEMEVCGPALVEAVSRELDKLFPQVTLTLEQGRADAPVGR